MAVDVKAMEAGDRERKPGAAGQLDRRRFGQAEDAGQPDHSTNQPGWGAYTPASWIVASCIKSLSVLRRI